LPPEKGHLPSVAMVVSVVFGLLNIV